MKKMSTVELQIAERARKHKGEALHSLYPFIDATMLQESYKQLNKRSAKGVDGKTWQQYGLEFPERRDRLLEEFRTGRYKAPAIRRVYIPKDKHGQRPLGIATIEDKVLQASVQKVIEPIYEEDFKPFYSNCASQPDYPLIAIRTLTSYPAYAPSSGAPVLSATM